MRNTKRILSLLLTVCMLATCFATVTFADDATPSTGTKFSDVAANSQYATAVTTLNQMGVINGYPDGTFGPDQNVTRAEFTAMLMRTLNYGSLGDTSAAKLPFTDIDDADSVYIDIISAGIISNNVIDNSDFADLRVILLNQ